MDSTVLGSLDEDSVRDVRKAALVIAWVVAASAAGLSLSYALSGYFGWDSLTLLALTAVSFGATWLARRGRIRASVFLLGTVIALYVLVETFLGPEDTAERAAYLLSAVAALIFVGYGLALVVPPIVIVAFLTIGAGVFTAISLADGSAILRDQMIYADIGLAVILAQILAFRSLLRGFALRSRREADAARQEYARAASYARDLEETLRKNERLQRELHHRVKNNLQILSSLLSLQSGRTENPDQTRCLEPARRRIEAIARMYDFVLDDAGRDRVALGSYASGLLASLAAERTARGEAVSVTLDADEAEVDSEAAVNCGLILEELVSNALSHAVPGTGRVEVRARVKAPSDGSLLLRVEDNGRGLPPDLDPSGPSAGLGLSLVTALAEQIGGRVVLEPDRRAIRVEIPARKT